jgi:hypothetical protein
MDGPRCDPSACTEIEEEPVKRSATPVDRTATFVFFLGDRLYGTVTAYVVGPEADQYDFTGALTVQVLKVLERALRPLIEPAPGQEIRSVLRPPTATAGLP